MKIDPNGEIIITRNPFFESPFLENTSPSSI